ncbi:hypothetical protein Hanom_Chr10g00872121 [Helianthus anomalus]
MTPWVIYTLVLQCPFCLPWFSIVFPHVGNTFVSMTPRVIYTLVLQCPFCLPWLFHQK